MFKWILKSFKRQLIFVLFSIFMIAGATSILKFYLDEKAQLNSILESQITHMSERFSLSISDQVFYNKYFDVSDSILSLDEYNDKAEKKFGSLFKIDTIAVVDKDNKVVGHSNPLKHSIGTLYKDDFYDNTILYKTNLRWNKAHTMLHLKTPIVFTKDLIGYVYMDINPIYLQKSEKALLRNLLVLVVVFSFLLFFFTLLFARWVDKPLNEIISNLSKLGENKQKFPICIQRKDEFFTLAQALKEADTRIYEQKKELLEIQKGLESTIEQRTQELIQKADTLAQTIEHLKSAQKKLVETEKMSALGSLVAGVAHEINTPLGVSLTGITHIEHETKIILKAMDENSLGKNALKEYLAMTKEMSQSMHLSLRSAAQLVRSFKQVAVDQHIEEKREFDLHLYVDEILLSLHNKFKHTQIKVKNKIDKSIYIRSYAGIYYQIISNLLVNSLLHAYDKTDVGLISLEAYTEDETLTLIYADDGKGLEESVRLKMFDPFFTTKMGQGGSGLGLNIIYNLIHHKLRGEVSCQSTLGEGMKVIITIPMKELS